MYGWLGSMIMSDQISHLRSVHWVYEIVCGDDVCPSTRDGPASVPSKWHVCTSIGKALFLFLSFLELLNLSCQLLITLVFVASTIRFRPFFVLFCMGCFAAFLGPSRQCIMSTLK